MQAGQPPSISSEAERSPQSSRLRLSLLNPVTVTQEAFDRGIAGLDGMFAVR
jgi:hypothetical protein